ncbi:MAG TPA: tRNA (N6-isopentenyl adenosine(37)-C2)-methylthiotransferase MiaB [Terriglobales bacterium]|nr:tRNA (N6-isopentenyl adenosine(37)-C2)-methylthiotransferase MiaB [Terriglobales bacterium]
MPAAKKTFWIETFGCQMNVHDSERVAGTLCAHGFAAVERAEEADLILFNTCSIREKAAQKVFQRLAQFRPLAKEGKQFGVLGCVAQQEGEAIFQRAPHVNLVAGSASYPRLAELIARLEAGEKRVTGLGSAEEAFETELTRRDHPFRAYLTIIEGCDKHCAYCVVPFTRGPERSRASASILAEARQLAAAGYSEVQLLGQNVNSYRDPSPARLSFAELLAAVAEVPGLRRVRFTTSHPRDFHPEIVRVLGEHETLCDHVHLPVQSGSSRVLAAMRRDYTREQYLERIAAIRACRRPLAITTDLIVGFPGESDEDFAATIELLDEVRYAGAFSFKYSPRPNTASGAWPDSVPEAVKAERLMILQRRQQEIQQHDNQSFVGRTLEVMVEGHNPKLGQWIGRASTNRSVNFTGSGLREPAAAALPIFAAPLRPGDYAWVRITKAGANSLVGEQAAAPAAAGRAMWKSR